MPGLDRPDNGGGHHYPNNEASETQDEWGWGRARARLAAEGMGRAGSGHRAPSGVKGKRQEEAEGGRGRCHVQKSEEEGPTLQKEAEGF